MKTSVLITLLLGLTPAASDSSDWKRFRGPQGAGQIDGPPVPIEWSAEKNLKWRTALPGKGVSSPVVANGRVYLTCYTGYGIDFENPGEPEKLVRHLLAFDRQSGRELWRVSVPSTSAEDPYAGFITQHGYASSTPVTDGENVYALLGKSGLFAFDRDGKQLWKADLGQGSDPAKWGDGSSPILVKDTVIVDAGILGNHIVGLDKRTGEQRWAVKDPTFTNSWATPTPVRVGDRTQILVHVPKKVLAIDPADGKILWSATSPLDDAACSSIVTKDGIAYLMGSRAGHALAVKCDGSGDVSGTHTVWQKRLRSGIGTPIIVGDHMYWTTGGLFLAASLETGEYVYRERLPRLGGPTGGFPNADYSSPIAVDGKIIQFTRSGESYVIDPDNEFKLVSHNPAFADDESAFSSTPAASDGDLFIRSDRFLYCIAPE